MVLLVATAGAACASGQDRLRAFADRPIAWHEHDDDDLPAAPVPFPLDEEKYAHFLRNLFTRESHRILSFEPPRPAEDVNALDEVPCSTWFCPRNHLDQLDLATLMAGPPGAVAPEPPFTILRGKAQGAAPGFIAKDARGRRYLVKMDPVGHPTLASGGEFIGNRLVHAAGYNVPGAFVIDLGPKDIRIGSRAYLRLSDVSKRPFTPAHLADLVKLSAVTGDGRLRAVAVPWLPGRILGGFDFVGRRMDDPNDRIAHENRRSLRVTYLLYGWLNVTDPGPRNTLDSYVTEAGRRFVRHYIIDFGTGFGAGTIRIKSPVDGREYFIDLTRMIAALGTLGIYQRAWQADIDTWRNTGGGLPEVGWYRPTDTWNPEEFRPAHPLSAHPRMTERDGYWGAKVITSFTDEQIRAVVAAAGYSPAAAAEVEHALRARRDRIGERYLTRFVAAERPFVSHDGATFCFSDVAIERQFLAPSAVEYRATIAEPASGADATRARIAWSGRPTSARTCFPLGVPPGANYLVVTLEGRLSGVDGASRARDLRPTSVHLRWRGHGRGYGVVGIERAE